MSSSQLSWLQQASGLEGLLNRMAKFLSRILKKQRFLIWSLVTSHFEAFVIPFKFRIGNRLHSQGSNLPKVRYWPKLQFTSSTPKLFYTKSGHRLKKLLTRRISSSDDCGIELQVGRRCSGASSSISGFSGLSCWTLIVWFRWSCCHTDSIFTPVIMH